MKKYVGLEVAIIEYRADDVLTSSAEASYKDGVGVNGSELWSTDK